MTVISNLEFNDMLFNGSRLLSINILDQHSWEIEIMIHHDSLLSATNQFDHTAIGTKSKCILIL